jgi:hypothetical protein
MPSKGLQVYVVLMTQATARLTAYNLGNITVFASFHL